VKIRAIRGLFLTNKDMTRQRIDANFAVTTLVKPCRGLVGTFTKNVYSFLGRDT
jgi:hypothetical protein